MTALEQVVVVAAGTSTGLLGGVLLAFSSAADRGLARLGDRGYVGGMQAVNTAILNPVFLTVFLASPVLLVVSAVLRGGELPVAAAVLGVGATVVTVAGNVPLNDRLAALDLATASDALVAEVRRAYERPWQRWNVLRVLLCAAALALLLADLAG